MVIYDGHSTHVDDRVIEAAIDNNITIIKIPPHTSHILQPLDLAVFKSFKQAWDENLISWQRKNHGQNIPKNVFSEYILEVWTKLDRRVIENGFAKAGIYPFNRTVVPKSAYDPEAFRRWEIFVNSQKLNDGNVENSLCEICGLCGACICLGLPHEGKSNENDQILNIVDDAIPSTSDNVSFENNASFESLLLETVKQSPATTKNKKKRVALGAEVITQRHTIEFRDIKNNKKKCKENTKPKKSKNSKHYISSSSDSSIDMITDNSDSDVNTDPLQFLNEIDMEITNTSDISKELTIFQDLTNVCSNHSTEESPIQENKIILNDWVLIKYCPKKVMISLGK